MNLLPSLRALLHKSLNALRYLARQAYLFGMCVFQRSKVLSASKVIIRRKRKTSTRHPHHLRKPEWVMHSVLALKLQLPDGTGVRNIVATFNRLQKLPVTGKDAEGEPHTISKSYVANILQAHELALSQAR